MTRTRFAPAPTGFLHLGHVANAIFVWGLAARAGAEVLLRLEDHDRERSRAEYEGALLDDLDWLGFVPDRYATDAFRAGRCESRQSERGDIYLAVAVDLAARGLVYPCRCTRQQIEAHAAASDRELRYPGTCRPAPGAGLTRLPPEPSGNVTWRLMLSGREESFDDLLAGPHTQHPQQQCGDVVIRDRRGNWTYQFVASVDDHLQGIDLVVRGRDLIESTGRQIQIARLVGRKTPARFAHHALIMKSPTQKLSKSDGDTGVRDLRAAGWSAARVIGEAARLAGLVDDVRDLDAAEAAALVGEAGIRRARL